MDRRDWHQLCNEFNTVAMTYRHSRSIAAVAKDRSCQAGLRELCEHLERRLFDLSSDVIEALADENGE